MKISSKQYAQALFELTRSKEDIDSVVLKFAEVLKKNKQMKLLANIIKKFGDIYNKENGIVEAEVITARELESEQICKVESFLKEKYQVKEIILNNIIDQKIKGGIILKVGDEILDGSILKKLKKLNVLLKNK